MSHVQQFMPNEFLPNLPSAALVKAYVVGLPRRSTEKVFWGVGPILSYPLCQYRRQRNLKTMNNNIDNEIVNGNGEQQYATGKTVQRAVEKLLKQAPVEPWPEKVELAALLEELSGLVRRFVMLQPTAADMIALWIVHTYGFDLREATAYLGVESPEKRCGKSTLLTLLSRLVSRPVVASNISAPAFFRVIEQTRPTLIIDEADTFLQKNNELRGILNSGYSESTAYVVRVANEKIQHPASNTQRSSNNQDSTSEANPELEENDGIVGGLRHYSCYCPKALAAIGRLPETLADRCIVVRMQRKRPEEICERLKKLTKEDALVLRRKCARVVADHAKAIESMEPVIPDELNDRAADIWEPLLVLAELAGKDWVERSHRAAASLCVTAQERSPTGALLVDLLMLFLMNQERTKFFTREVVGWLNRLDERPWWELRRSNEVTDVWLAQKLKPYGITPKMVWMNGEQGRGYTMEQCEETFKRYIPRAEWEVKRAEMKQSTEERKRAEELAKARAMTKDECVMTTE
jgi:hypothetical protein